MNVNSKAFRISCANALMLSAAVATMLPEAVQAAPARVRVSGIARVRVTNIPSVNLNGTPLVRLEPGSAVALQPGSAVTLQPGTTVGLQPGATVSLPANTQVGLAPGATVNVNSASTVSVTDAAAREAFQMEFPLSMADGVPVAADDFSVLVNRILVLEYLSCSMVLPSNQDFYVEIETKVGIETSMHSFVPERSFPEMGSINFKRHILSASTRLYADPDTTVTLTLRRSGTTGAVNNISCSLSGYYVAP